MSDCFEYAYINAVEKARKLLYRSALYAILFYTIFMYLSVWIHELGHATALILLPDWGLEKIEVIYPYEGHVYPIAPNDWNLRMDEVFIVGIMGGLFELAFYLVLCKWNKWFIITIITRIPYVIGEAILDYDLQRFGGTLGFFAMLACPVLLILQRVWQHGDAFYRLHRYRVWLELERNVTK